jgi:hypothetical protein
MKPAHLVGSCMVLRWLYCVMSHHISDVHVGLLALTTQLNFQFEVRDTPKEMENKCGRCPMEQPIF